MWSRLQPFVLDRTEGTRETPISGMFELKLKNVHTALVKMDNIRGGGWEGKVQIREHWRLFLKRTVVFSFPLL